MKFSLTFLVLFTAVGLASAALPTKVPLQNYRSLWDSSPFTSKPPPSTQGPAEDPLKDYALIGVAPFGEDSYRITLINKKQPDERIMVFSDGKDPKFKILGVTRKAGDPLGTVVSLQSGSITGTVTYDEKLLTLTPPAAAPQQVQPGQPPVPGMPPNQNGGQMRQPRPRVVPPPTPTNPQQVQPAQQQQRPQRRRN